MIPLLVSIGTALWLGILTSVSPCPLATNIAAVSYVGRRVGTARSVLFAGLLYTAGRALSYIGVALLVSRSLQMIPGVSLFLQKYMNLALGPLLAGVGTLLTGVIPVSFGGGAGNRLESIVDKSGLWGAGLLGMVFALAFCPVSAGLFFGALLPLALQSGTILMATLYGIGTALPVIALSFILAFSAHLIGAAFSRITAVEKWVRRITAVAMIGIGIYLILVHNFSIRF